MNYTARFARLDGFLAENPALASLCAASNIIFVGPHPTHVTMFGDKLASKDAAIKAGVPVVPGSPGPVAGVDAVKGWGDKVGYPIVIKNAAGGGGRGIRIVRAAGEVAEAYARCVGEVAGGAVFVEKAVIGGRHIEVQVIGDGKDAVHLYERDCSVQRRFQKIVEIAPSPDLDPKLREQICADAVKLAKSVGYRSLGTVEFMVQGGKHYFLEVNPRIQVEHTCTEQVTGHDLVALQLAIAQGATISSLGLVQSQIKTQGFAIQLRVTAEDPLKAFEPSNGDITKVQLPAGPGIRVDTHLHLLRPRSRVERPIEVGPFFDSLLAKTIVTAPTWELARNKALRACRETLINGVATNTLFLERLMEHPAFASYKAINTLWVEDNMAQFTVAPTIPPPEITSTLTSTSSEAEDGGSVLPVKGSTAHTLELNWNVATADNPDVMPDYEEHQITIRSLQPDKVDASLLSARVQIDGTDLEVRIHPAIIAGGKDDIEGLVKCAAPHDGLLVSFAVKEGDMVNEGDEVAVISRMKMVRRGAR